jgi:hypothetical protein
MKNDAKLGMLAGVLGVIVAAVLFVNNPPTAKTLPGAVGSTTKEKTALPTPMAATPPETPAAPGEANTAALPATPVLRTRKDLDAQPASRASGTDSGMDEEP